MSNIDWRYLVEMLLSTWDPATPVPFESAEYEKVILTRIKNDIEGIDEAARGYNYTEILREWESYSRSKDYSETWKSSFTETKKCKVNFENQELADLISQMFWSKEHQNLGYAAEAIFLKYISQLRPNNSGCFHRLPTFGRFDLYESRTHTFIDVKHSLKEHYEVKFYQLKKGSSFSFRANYYVPERKYNFAYLPLKIIEIHGSEVKFVIRPLKSLEEVLSVINISKLKAAI